LWRCSAWLVSCWRTSSSSGSCPTPNSFRSRSLSSRGGRRGGDAECSRSFLLPRQYDSTGVFPFVVMYGWVDG
jgi:hypothetical protein